MINIEKCNEMITNIFLKFFYLKSQLFLNVIRKELFNDLIYKIQGKKYKYF